VIKNLASNIATKTVKPCSQIQISPIHRLACVSSTQQQLQLALFHYEYQWEQTAIVIIIIIIYRGIISSN
jgi:hypothetical protein